MYDINKFKHGNIVTVGEIIDVLSKFNKDAEFRLNDCDEIYIHSNKDELFVNMTNDPYDGYYIYENENEFFDTINKYNFGGKLYNDMVEVKVTNKSGKELTRLVKEDDYNDNSLETLSIYSSYLKSADPDFITSRDNIKTTGTKFSYFKEWYKEDQI